MDCPPLMTELPLDGDACTPQDGLFGGELQGSRGSPARIAGGESVKFPGYTVGFFGESTNFWAVASILESLYGRVLPIDSSNT